MSDLINRPDAIETLLIGCEMLRRVLDDLSIVGRDREKFSWGLGLIESYIDDINELPSAEPEQWNTCFDCPLSHGCPVINGCTNEQAMEYAGEIPDNCPLSAEPQRKKGEWDYTDDMYETYKCSECGFNTDDYIEYNFCPNCGADMRGEQE